MFKEGQAVYCVFNGEGVVAEIEHGSPKGVLVNFKGGGTDWYYHTGKFRKEGNRCLFFSEPKINALTSPPFEPTLVGKYIVYKTNAFGSYQYSMGAVLQEEEDCLVVTSGTGPRLIYKPLSYTVLDESQLPK